VHMHLNRYMKPWIFRLAAIDNRRQGRPTVWSDAPPIIIIIEILLKNPVAFFIFDEQRR
jgi:hypothetical protein